MPYVTGSAPHIRHPESASGLFWKMVVSLIPAVILSLYFFKGPCLRVIGSAVSAAVLGEVAGRTFLKKKITLEDGSAILTGLLLALTLPSSFPSWIIAIVSFFLILLGKEIFGGLGANLFQLAALGNVFCQICFPDFFTDPPQGMAGMLLIAFFSLGGLFLMMKKVISWEPPFIFLAAFFISSFLLEKSLQPFLSPAVFLAAFYLITDYSTAPATRAGLRLFALGSALLAAFLAKKSIYFNGLYFSILLMNALVPWIDAAVRPKISAAIARGVSPLR